jgi:hypothetical protein
MKLRADDRVRPAWCGDGPRPATAPDGGVDLRRLPWADATFAAIELDDAPAAADWTTSGPALEEIRRVLKRHGMLELRTRRLPPRDAVATEHATMAAFARLLQNHGFDVVALDVVEDAGSLISAIALRRDGPEDAFDDRIAATSAHLTLHGPMLDPSPGAGRNRALAASLDENGVKVRVRVIFEVLDGLYCD